MGLPELLTWCQAHLTGGFNLRIHILPMSHQVRVWIQADQEGRRRVIVTDPTGAKFVGVAPLTGTTADVDRAAADLLAQLQQLDGPQPPDTSGQARLL